MRESPQETLSRLGPYPRYPDRHRMRFALFRWTSERAASIRCPDGGSGQGSFASFLKGPLPPSGHRIERGTIDLQSDINCLPERSLLGAFGKQHDDYDHDVFNSAGSTLATPILVQRI